MLILWKQLFLDMIEREVKIFVFEFREKKSIFCSNVILLVMAKKLKILKGN